MTRSTPSRDIERFLRTGEHDMLGTAWPGKTVAETAVTATASLREALVTAVLSRTRDATLPDNIDGTDHITITRNKVRPMVRGLFPAIEQPAVLDVLARSVVYLTPRNVEAILRAEMHMHSAWSLANLYLISCDVAPLSADVPETIGLSRATTCFVSMQYFGAGDRFDDVVVHEAAHIFHNCKRKRIGLKATRRREWLLDIAFGKRETFAYACEALSRIHELGPTLDARRRLLSEVEAGPMPSDKTVDASELIDILHEAVSARNGWKRILQRCGPPGHRTTTMGAPT